MSRLPIPAAALKQHVIALGKTGSGKSSKLRVLVEHQLAQDVPVCILDPKGDWWGLKSSADGKSAGFPLVIFGGKHADVPINARAGAAIAELIFTGNRPCIIDLREFGTGERTRFFIDFASTAFKITSGRRTLVIAEAHNFAPKGKIFSVEAGEMLHWANKLAAEARSLGIDILADSQRPQKVHNDFLTSCETLIACRVIHKADREAIGDWIDGCADPEVGKEVLRDLAGMPRTDAWVWSPEIGFGPKRIEFPMFETYDSFAPQAAGTKKLKGWAEVNLAQISTQLAIVVAEAQGNDPKYLKLRISQLEQALAKRPIAPAVDKGQLDREKQAAEDRGYARGAADSLRAQRAAIANLRRDLPQVVLAAIDDAHIPPVVKSIPAKPNVPITPRAPVPSLGKTAAPVQRPAPSSGNGEAPTGLQKVILNALAWLEAKGIERPSRQMVGAVAGKSAGGGYFSNTVGAMKTAGLIEFPGSGTMVLTDAGRVHADPPDSRGEIHEQWLSILSGLERGIVQVLVDAHPEPLSREAVGTQLGKSHEGGYFSNTLGRLHTIGAVDYPSKGMLALSRHVMP